MKNVYEKEKNILLKIQTKNKMPVICNDSTLDPVLVYDGMIITAAEIKDCDVEICIGEDASVVIRNIDKNEVMVSWNNEYVNEPDSSFLFYALSEKVELLLYRSPEQDQKFCLACIPKRNPSTGEILSKIKTLPYYQAYTQIRYLIVPIVYRPYKNKYRFVYDRYKNKYRFVYDQFFQE